jgi:hypothetical protein
MRRRRVELDLGEERASHLNQMAFGMHVWRDCTSKQSK